ncbi:DNA repair protein RadC [Oleiagrimonas citrea]|uniref:DNA repair protein RadC n=1 Tax=Oleiagrimonas citrea TaxID=1665687 RepID=A0A846ZQ70_9GAMM|nr:DNA repair protein RadC [Oleiagrimonas citrea]NKZ40156.1 DNA repair protein RadC [Oleiagrimonas citrea]
MGIADWPRSERPRERLLKHGATALSDAELLAVLLGSGTRGKDAVALGRELLQAGGNLSALLSAAEPPRLSGLGQAKHARLAAGFELARRALGEELDRGAPLRDPVDSAAYLKARLRDLPHEVFACLYLDNRHRVLGFEELFRGTIDGASVHPREVVRACMRHNAAAVIFAHNHPSGVAEPSAADRTITLQLREALQMIDVRVLDHLVVGSGMPVSMAARGLI